MPHCCSSLSSSSKSYEACEGKGSLSFSLSSCDIAELRFLRTACGCHRGAMLRNSQRGAPSERCYLCSLYGGAKQSSWSIERAYAADDALVTKLIRLQGVRGCQEVLI